MGAVSFQDVEPMPYNNIYYHDYHGWRDTLTICNEAFNAFNAESDEILTTVSFYTAMDNIDYSIHIYDLFENNELTDELSIESGTIDYIGFHTIDLYQPVNLKKGDDFYIYLKLSEGGHPFDRTSEIPVLLGASYEGTIVKSKANLGESYYLQDGLWYDLYNYEFEDSRWTNSANFCIKGLVSKISDLECNDNINLKGIKPSSTVTFNLSINNIGESYSKLNWIITDWPDWGTWSFSLEEDYLYPESGAEIIQVSVVAPDDRDQNFSGVIKIINKENNSDYELIQVSLATPANKNLLNSQILQFLEETLKKFPLLERVEKLLSINKLLSI